MRHKLFTLVAGASLLGCLAVCVLWARSGRRIEWVQWTGHRHFPGLVSSGGRIVYSYQYFPTGVGGNEPGLTAGSRPGEMPYWGPGQAEASRRRVGGFEWSPAAGALPPAQAIGKWARTPTTFVAAAPHWFVALLALIPPVLWWGGRGRRRARAGLCVDCGYDLRASPERCPECGRPSEGRGIEPQRDEDTKGDSTPRRTAEPPHS